MEHPRPYYYLENFRTAIAWLEQRYADLLNETEAAFIAAFRRLPVGSAALLVRMLGREGDLFRHSKLDYREIGCINAAAESLIDQGWLEPRPLLSWTEMGRMLRKFELHDLAGMTAGARHLRKLELLELLALGEPQPRLLREWQPQLSDRVYRLNIKPLAERLRLLFFGNFRQQWSEFVLSDLGIFRYETVAQGSRAFQNRLHVDAFYALYDCRCLMGQDPEPSVEAVLQMFPDPVTDNDWLETRRRKLLFQFGRWCERCGNLVIALDIYRRCEYAGARIRVIRLLERLERFEEALDLATTVRGSSTDEFEQQIVGRMWPRLCRRNRRTAGVRTGPRTGEAGRPAPDDASLPAIQPVAVAAPAWHTFQLTLPVHERPHHLEMAVGGALLEEGASVYFVESRLINALFGLLCWSAIFAPVPGAFFHEFHAAPADLHQPQFRNRRTHQFAACFAQLRRDGYRTTIRRNFELKQGIQSPFVAWGLLTPELLDAALECIAPLHLEAFFQRLLNDLRSNTSGLPDLVQFWPAQRRYRLIEVKGPGDRLQDNQLRWLSYCASHAIPVSVCHVGWNSHAV